MGWVPAWSPDGALCQLRTRPADRARPSCRLWLSSKGHLQAVSKLSLSQNQPRLAGDARSRVPLKPTSIILPTVTGSPKGQSWLTLTAETAPQTCLWSYLMMMDPHRYLQGKSKVRSCILRQGTGAWGCGLGRWAPLRFRGGFKKLEPGQGA